MSEIKKYETGAMRDSSADACMVALAPWAGLRRLGRTMAEGSEKYEPHNWRAGFKWVQTMNHVLLHCAKWLERDDSEDHLGHALAGLMFLCEFEETHPELDDRYIPRPTSALEAVRKKIEALELVDQTPRAFSADIRQRLETYVATNAPEQLPPAMRGSPYDADEGKTNDRAMLVDQMRGRG